MKKFFLFLKKYWLIIAGVIGAILLLLIKLTGGKSVKEEQFIAKVKEQKKANDEAIKKAKAQVVTNEEVIATTDEVIKDVSGSTDDIIENKKERDKKADNIFGVKDD